MKIFKHNKTKWIPIGLFKHGSRNKIVFARRNIKTGMLYFKVKVVNKGAHINPLLSLDLSDVRSQWDVLCSSDIFGGYKEG